MASPSDPELESARERGWRELGEIDAALDRGEIDEDGWHAAVLALVEPAYLAGETPQLQSGKSGDARSWEQAVAWSSTRSTVTAPSSTSAVRTGC